MIYAVNTTNGEHRIPDSGDVTSRNEVIIYASPITGWVDREKFSKIPIKKGMLVDVEHRDGDVYCSVKAKVDIVAGDWDIDGSDGDIIAYRPILDVDTKPEPPAWDGESWPPPIGCVLETKAHGTKAKIIAIEDGHVIGWDAEYTLSGTLDREECRPIRSEEDRAREAIAEEVLSAMDNGLGSCFKDVQIATVIYAAIRAGKIPGVKLEGSND